MGTAWATDLDPVALKWSAAAEGGAVKLKIAAQDLARTAEQVKAAGRIGWLPVLRSQADELVRRAELLERLTAVEAEERREGPGETPTGRPPARPQ